MSARPWWRSGLAAAVAAACVGGGPGVVASGGDGMVGVGLFCRREADQLSDLEVGLVRGRLRR